MNVLRSLFVASILGAASLMAADSSDVMPEFRGVLSLGGEQRFSLSTPGGTQTAWLTVGESFSDYQIAAYKAAEETLILKKNGVEYAVHMMGSQVKAGTASTKATFEQADEILRKMNFEVMIKKILDQQKKAATNMTKQMVARMGGGANADEIAAHQAKVMDVLFKEMDIEGMQKDVAKIYSEVFTAEELRGYSEYLSTASGQAMIDKQPEIQQKMMEAMMPRMQNAMPKIQQMSIEFAKEQAAKKAAQQAPAPAAPAAPKP